MQIGFLLFPNVTQLDFTGPLQFLSRIPGAETVLIAKTMDPIETDTPMCVLPTHTYETAPALDLICVPGGFGTAEAIEDEATLEFVRNQAETAQYVTSVCTGALILGAAGLLKGKKATTHWAYHDLLAHFGAIPTEGRVVQDGNIFTGGGVTAGIDFALTVIAAVAGEETARALQLGLEYDPDPPFQSGHPRHVSEDDLERMKAFYGPSLERADAAIRAATGSD